MAAAVSVSTFVLMRTKATLCLIFSRTSSYSKSSISAKNCAVFSFSFTCTGITLTAFTVSVRAIPSPFRSRIAPRFGVISLSLVCCSYASSCNSSARKSSIKTSRPVSSRYPHMEQNRKSKSRFFAFIVGFSIQNTPVFSLY